MARRTKTSAKVVEVCFSDRPCPAGMIVCSFPNFGKTFKVGMFDDQGLSLEQITSQTYGLSHVVAVIPALNNITFRTQVKGLHDGTILVVEITPYRGGLKDVLKRFAVQAGLLELRTSNYKVANGRKPRNSRKGRGKSNSRSGDSSRQQQR